MAGTSIEWTERTWNPVVECSRVTPVRGLRLVKQVCTKPKVVGA